MQKFLTFVVQVGVLVGLVILAVTTLDLPPEIATYAVLAGVGLVALVALLGILRSIPLGKLRLPRRRTKDPEKARLRAEAAAMRAALRARMRTLVGARHPLLSKGNLSEPWWVMLGPEGSGKTTLCAATGGAEVEGRGPRITKTQNSVLVEVDVTADPTLHVNSPLRSFLEELQRWRPEQPIDGIMVCLRHDSALEQIEETQRYLQEIADFIDVQVPVVTVVTHTDSLPGFSDFVGELHADRPPLGAFLPLCETASRIQETALSALSAEGGALSWIRQRSFSLMIESSGAHDEVIKLHEFSEAFTRTASASTQWLHQLMRKPILGGESVRIRGLFFVGRSPELTNSLFADELLREVIPWSAQYAARSRRRVNRLRQRRWLYTSASLLLGSLVLIASVRSSQSNRSTLNETFRAASKLDSSDTLASPEDVEALRKSVAIWRADDAPHGQGLGLFRADIVGPAVSREYTRLVCQRVIVPLVQRTSETLHRFARDLRNKSTFSVDIQTIALDNLRLYLLLSHPSQVSSVGDLPVPNAWDSAETEWVVGRVMTRWSQTLSGSDADCSSCKASIEQYRDIVRAAQQTETAGDNPCGASAPPPELIRDTQLVDTIRSILVAGKTGSIEYNKIIHDANEGRDGAVTLIGLAGKSPIQQRSEAAVDRAFTKAGWDDIRAEISALLNEKSSASQWLLPSAGVSEKGTAKCAELREKYVTKYVEAWTFFITSIYVEPAGSLDEAESLLAALSGEGDEREPLPALFKALAANTTYLPPISCADRESLEIPAPEPGPFDRITSLFGQRRGGIVTPSIAMVKGALLDQEGAKMSSMLVANHFSRLNAFAEGESSGLVTYQKLIHDLWQQIAEANLSGKIEELSAEQQTQSRKVRDLIREADLDDFRASTEGMLLPPLEGIGPIIREGEYCKITRDWEEMVVDPLALTTELYPFAPTNSDSTTLRNVESLFHPETGAIAQFRTKHLTPYLKRQGDGFIQRPYSGKNRNPISQRVVDFFNQAQTLGSLLFPRGGEAKVEFELLMRCGWASKVLLNIEGVEHSYICDSRGRKSASWPGEEPISTFSAVGEGFPSAVVTQRGDFAFLKLLELDANPKRTDDAISLNFDLNVPNRDAINITMKFNGLSGDSIFYSRGSPEFLSPWRVPLILDPPRTLFPNVGECHGGGAS